MWTQDAYALVEREWSAGLSASQISAKLARDLNIPKTRNAVIGVIHRRRLPPRLVPQRGPVVRVRRDHSWRKKLLSDAKQKNKPAPEPAPIPVEPLHIPFLERQVGQCRAITDATRYAQKVCGHLIEGEGVFCKWHRALYYVKPDPKKKPRARV